MLILPPATKSAPDHPAEALTPPARVVLGLGANLGDRRAVFNAAIRMLAEDGILTGPIARSRLYRTPALLPPRAPADWDRPYLNGAVMAETPLDPKALLAATQAIERRLGRRPGPRWAPRLIDLDILVYASCLIQDPLLTIPHARLTERSFALLPLADLWPDWIDPVTGLRAEILARRSLDHAVLPAVAWAESDQAAGDPTAPAP